jgi:hypothetical protein
MVDASKMSEGKEKLKTWSFLFLLSQAVADWRQFYKKSPTPVRFLFTGKLYLQF